MHDRVKFYMSVNSDVAVEALVQQTAAACTQRIERPTVHNPTTTATMASPTGSSASSQSIPSPLPSPVCPSSLSMETPSLGSSELLPRPKRGAPPVAPATPKPIPNPKDKKKKGKKEDKNKPLDPALCEGW
ncbi:hypothetical protein B0H19DRAFT_1366404 [Mycena capillaripes]|nr:hypothetical protein B0H19DRAFT_1366404 [Mycena capillaripes]